MLPSIVKQILLLSLSESHFKMGRLSWIIEVSPVGSQGPCEREAGGSKPGEGDVRMGAEMRDVQP